MTATRQGQMMEQQDYRDVPDRPNPYALYPWLAIAAGPVADVASGRDHPAWLAGAGLAAFAIGYMGSIWLRLNSSRRRTAYLLLALLAAVTLAMTIGFGVKMTGTLFPLLSLACGAVIPWREFRYGPPAPILVIFALALTAAVIDAKQRAPASDVWQTWYGTLVGGLVVTLIFRFIQAIGELRRTRLELARTAVEAERLRFGRDLHDLLGHTLSVMVLKAQVVRKLATGDPEAAATQATDIERVGRQALTEVRQAVSGYRGRGLTGELEAARTALADAGYTADVGYDGALLPADTDALLGWVIREGVTNVIKHSAGHRCQISVRAGESPGDNARVTVQITDDGAAGRRQPDTARPLPGLPSGGHGLTGLRERVAAGGGTLTAGPRPGGGYRLAVTVPVPPGLAP